jgi:hypothetical protein
METRNNDDAIRWSAFWRRTIEPVIFGTTTPEESFRCLRELSTFHLRFPDGTFRKPTLRSLQHALDIYLRHGFGEWEDRPSHPPSPRGKPS